MTVTVEWNPLDPASIRDPYPIYAKLREYDPVHWHPGMRSWVLTRYDDCQRVLRDYDVFARDRRRIGEDRPEAKVNIQTQDPPEQAALRGITAKSLTSQPLERICAEAGGVLEEKLLKAAKNGPFDLMRDVAGPAAIRVINRVFGVDEFTQGSYAPIFQGLTQAMDRGLDPERLAPGAAAGQALRAEVDRWTERRLGTDGMLGAFYANEQIALMSKDYVNNTLVATYNAGFSTIFTSTGAVTHELLRVSGALEAVRGLDTADRSVMVTAVDELLRYTSPAQATARAAVEETEIQGVTIAPGDTLVTVLAAANRDPRQFDDPDELLLDRSPNQHLAFAWGPHICLGARLAQAWVIELATFLSVHGSRLRLLGGETYMNAATLRNLVSLPVEYS